MSRPGGLIEAFGDFVRVGIADVGNTYQRVMFGSETPGPPGVMVTTHDPEPEPPMSDRQLQQLIDQQPGYADTWPAVARDTSPSGESRPDGPPAGLIGQVLSPERAWSTSSAGHTRIADGPIEGQYQDIGPSPALPPPDQGMDMG